MKDKLDFYIDGKWVRSESNELIEIINPANEEIIGHVTAGTKEDIDLAVNAASNAFKTYSESSKVDRIELINNVLAEYENRYQDFVDTITEEMGAPIWLSNRAQASTGMKNFHETLDALKDYEFEKEEGDYILKEIRLSLKRGERVELRGFGIFSTKIQKARISRNPRTGEKVNTTQKKIIHFKMAKDLFKKLNDEEK